MSFDLLSIFSVGAIVSVKAWAKIFIWLFSLSAFEACSENVACKSIGPPLYKKKISETFFWTLVANF